MLSASTPISRPLSNRDYDFFYQGLSAGQLLVQKCAKCGALRNPPGPMCPRCKSFEWSPHRCSGHGRVHSYTVHYHPPLPGFNTPHVVLLADMEEGFRLVGSSPEADGRGLKIGMPVHIEFVRSGDTATFQFRAD